MLPNFFLPLTSAWNTHRPRSSVRKSLVGPRAEEELAQRLGGLVGDLDGVLQDGLGDALLGGERGRLGGEEAAEVLVGLGVLGALQLPLQRLDPHRHEVDVLQEDPSPLLHAPLQRLLRHGLLPLPHADVDKLAVFDGEALGLEQRVEVGDDVGAWEEVEEHGGLRRGLPVDGKDIEGLLVNVPLAQRWILSHPLPHGARQAIRSHLTQEDELLEVADLLLEALELLASVRSRPGGLRQPGLHLGVERGRVEALPAEDDEANFVWVEHLVADEHLERDGRREEKLVLVEEPAPAEVEHL
eukprot:280071-Hanusia_phi.AAC.1